MDRTVTSSFIPGNGNMATLSSPHVRRQQQQQQQQPQSYNGRGYATLNNANGGRSSAKKNYAGTMLGNGSLGRAGAAAPAAAAAGGNGEVQQQQSDASKYIVSPEQEAKNAAALATHV